MTVKVDDGADTDMKEELLTEIYSHANIPVVGCYDRVISYTVQIE